MVKLVGFPFVETQRDEWVVWAPAVDQGDQFIRADLSFRHFRRHGEKLKIT